MTHWLLVSSPSNFETSRGRSFDIAGMKTRWKKAAAEVKPGDTVFYYLTGVKSIGGESIVSGESFYDEKFIWESTKPGEVYPWRFPVKIVKAREAGDYLAVESFLGDYENVKKWPAKNWTLAFQGNVHRLTDHDYKLISGLL